MVGREMLASQRTQRGTRSTFEEEVVSLVFEILNCLGKFHGGAGMIGPVAGSVVSAAVMGRPVTVETKARAGGRKWILATASRNGSTMGSIMAEWKA